VRTFLAGVLIMLALGGVSYLAYDRLAIGAAEQFGFESTHVGEAAPRAHRAPVATR
jgi:hypothetical protein